jgi:hypothetical protein
MLRSDADAPKPPAYPFIYQSVSKSHRQTKNVRCANFLAYPFAPCLQIFRTVPSASAFASIRHRHVSASVRRYLRSLAATCKREKRDPGKKVVNDGKGREILGLAQETPQWGGLPGKKVARMARRIRDQAAIRLGRACLGSSRIARSVAARAA